MFYFFLILFLIINQTGNLHSCILDGLIDHDEDKMTGQVKRLIGFYETIVVKEKKNEDISCLHGVPFCLKKNKVQDADIVRERHISKAIPYVEEQSQSTTVRERNISNGTPYVEEQNQSINGAFVFDCTKSERNCNDYFSIWYESFKIF